MSQSYNNCVYLIGMQLVPGLINQDTILSFTHFSIHLVIPLCVIQILNQLSNTRVRKLLYINRGFIGK